MTVHRTENPSTHFGRQVKKERLARGWTQRELSARSGVDFSYLSKIESGKRPPTEAVADAMDNAFPERRGWFREYYEDSKHAIPAGLRSWAEHEDKAARLYVWCPGIVDGLLQTPHYARTLLRTFPGVTSEEIGRRLARRMERQQRVLYRRDDPPNVWFVVDELSLYRCVGSPEIMAAQMSRLLEVASQPNVTMHVLPAREHPANASDIIIADDAAYAESLAGGGTHTGTETFTRLERLMTTIIGESYRVSESTARIQRMRETWNRFTGSPPTPTRTEERA
jgi:transcriptional regulator with XRE-family HTH domain